jgi:hypothetical protein
MKIRQFACYIFSALVRAQLIWRWLVSNATTSTFDFLFPDELETQSNLLCLNYFVISSTGLILPL